jgi:Zn-dependent M28 family amino/carboxypeptidase
LEAPRPASAADQLRETVLASSQAWEVVRSLVDEVGPRFSGTPGDRAAVAWALRTLEAKGFANVRAEKVTVPRWERGAEAARLVAPYPHELSLAALGGSVGTPPGGLEAEVVGAATIETLERLPAEAVKGKIVFFSARMDRTHDGATYGTAGRVRWDGPSAAARKGAAGVVIRSVGTGQDRFPHTGAMTYEPDAPKIPAAALAIPDAEMLERLLSQGKPVRLAMTLGSRTLPDAESANVMGDVPGSEAPAEIVLLGAHLDSWDITRGAMDDGAGCAIVIEAARAIAALPRRPRRTVRVVLFANEENGLAGAKAYAAAHKDEIERHVVGLEADLGDGRVLSARLLGADAARPAFQEITRALAPLGVTASTEDASGGADMSPLRWLGVPVVDLRQDATRYFDVHHTANDTLAKIVKADLDQATAAFATFAFAAADMSGDFGRIPEEKRKRRR